MTVLPNSFPTANLYVDRAMELLTDPELRVLLFTVRHIMGWQDKVTDRKGYISLTMYENGFTTKEGTHFSGCGLKRGAIIKAVQGLVKYGFISRMGKPTDKGQLYQLIDAIDWNKLEERRSEKQSVNIKRTAKATDVRVNGTSDIPVTSDVTMQGTSDVTMQGNVGRTQTNPSSKPLSKSAVQSTGSRNLIFDAVAEHIFEINPLEIPEESGGRIGIIAAWLNKKIDGVKRGGEKVGFISQPAEPEHVKRFAAWYKSSYKDRAMPYDLVKFVDYWRKWATSVSKAAARRPAPITNFNEPTAAELEAQRAELEAARKAIRPDWEKAVVNE